MQKPRLLLLRCRDEASEMFAFGYAEYLLHAFPKVGATLADDTAAAASPWSAHKSRAHHHTMCAAEERQQVHLKSQYRL